MSNPLLAFRRDDDFSFGGAARGLPPGVHLEFYGGGKGGSSTQTVSIPPEVLARYNAVNARAENVAQTPFTPYSTDPNAFVADLTSSQKAGISNINAQQGAANQAVNAGQDLQMQGIGTAQTGQRQANAINQAALQGISQAQQQGTAYNQAAGKNIGNAMNSAAPYMQQMAGLTQAGLGQGQQYLGGATDLTQQAIQTGQQYANKAEPYYTGALQAGQPLNQQAQRYMQAGTQAVTPNALDYGQYMNPYMSDVVQAQQALQAQENAQQRSALQGKAIQSGAFGGDRAGIEQANLARQQSLANQATMANLLQSGYGQAQAAAQQQQGVGLGAAQANRAAQQAAAQQAAALGQQQYAQQLGVGTGLSALGQQQYGQALGTGSQLGTLGQQGYTQNLGAGAQLGQVGQNLYAQNIGQGQAIQGLGNQQFTQGLQGSQAASGIGQSIFGNAAQTAGIQQAGGMNTANLGLQNQAAQIAAAQAQMAAGQQQQQTQQAGKTALYNQFLQQQGYPFQIAQFLANIAMGTGALSGSTTSASRTGQRGGRMGDGYASGGLVPDSQGGAVYEPGLYGRGGYAEGGVPPYINRPDENGYENWYDASGRQVSSSDPALQDWVNAGQPSAKSTKPAVAAGTEGTEGDPSSWNNFVKSVYQKNFGRDPDPQGMAYWGGQLASGAVDKGSFGDLIGKSAQGADAAAYNQRVVVPQKLNADTTAIAGLNPDVAALYQEVLGRAPDPGGAKYYNDMLKAGMSLDQIKYNMQHSTEAGLKSGDVNALKGTPLTYDASKFSQPVAPVRNQYGAFSAGDFETPAAQTPNWMNSYNNLRGGGYGQPQGGGYSGGYGDAMPMGGGYGGGLSGYGQPQGYGNMSAMQGGYGGYGGGLGGYGGGMMGGYGQPSNYGMPNFGSSPQYGGAPDYAGAMQYGGMQSQYGMPQGYGMQQQGYGMPQQSYYPQQQQYQQYQPPMQSTPAIPQSVLDRYNATNGQQAFTQTAPTQDAQFQQFQQSQQQAAPTATGKGAAPAMGTDGLAGSTTAAQTTAAPQASGKGASQAPQATGKGASGMAGGGRAGFADGGRAGYAAGGGDPSSVLRGLISQYDPGDPQGLVARQAAMFAGAPGAGAAGYVPPSQGGAGQYKMLQPQASILPQQQGGIQQAISMGTSIASLGEAGSKLFRNMTTMPGTDTPADTLKEGLGNFADKTKKYFGFGSETPAAMSATSMTVPAKVADLGGLNPDAGSSLASLPDLTGGSADWSSLFGGFAANGGRIGYSAGGIPGLNDLKQGYAGIPGNEGVETPMSQVVVGGTKTPTELKAEMDRMSGGAGGGGGGGSGGGSSALGTAASIASLGMTAYKIGSTVLPLLFAASDKRMKTDIKAIGKTFDGQTIHRYKYKGDPKTQIGLIAQEVEEAHPNAVGLAGGMKTVNYDTATREAAKRGHFAAGGSAQDLGINPEDPKYQQMEVSFDNLLQRYDNNPLLAAAAMDVGTKVIDAAIHKAEQTGGDITDFLPRRTQEYMFALSKAAMGAHDAMSRPARAAGGRLGYANRGGGLASEMGTMDEFNGLAPANAEGAALVQLAGAPPTADKPKYSPRDIDYMARTLMTEAGNQGDQGMAAVGHVIKNRYDSGKFGPDIASIVTAPKQFTPWNPDAVGTKNDPRLIDANSAAYKKASEMATGILGGSVTNPLPEEHRGALNFANPKLSTAKWVPELVNSGNYAQIGAHVFGTSGAAPKGGSTPPANAGEQKPGQVASTAPVITATGLAPPRTDKSSPRADSIGKTISDSVPTSSSFWVPLIAGLGSMLASDKYRFSQRLGEGLVGGAAAFGKQQEFGLDKEKLAQQAAQNAALMGLKRQEFGLKQQEFTLTERTQAIQIMQQLQKINLGRQMSGQPELSAEDYFKQIGASNLLPAAKAPAAAPTAAPTAAPPVAPVTTPPAPAGGLTPKAGVPAVGLQPPALAPAFGASATPQSVAAATPGIPSIKDPFWATVDRSDSLPVMEKNWNLAMAVGDTATANTIMQRMDAIKKTGEVMVGGKVTHIPGWLDAQAAVAAAKETATKQAGLDYLEQIGPGGEKFVPALAKKQQGTTSNIPPASPGARHVEPAGAAPQKAMLDPKTGQVKGSIPAPPPGGGYPMSKQPGATGPTYAAQRLAKNDEQFEKDFMEKTQTMDTAIERLDQMANSFKMIHSGAMEDKLKGYAALAASYGDQKLAARILGGQVGAVAAAQLIDKNKVNLVLDTLKAANPRFAQSEFLKLSDVGSPDIAIDPTANHGMISANKGIMEWSRQFTRDWEKAKEAGWQSPSVFFSEWSQLNPLSTFQESARRRMGTFGGMELPPANEWIEGAVYHVPKGLKGRQAEQMGRAGLKGGDTFRFSGNVIERVKPSELFKYGQ